MSAGYSSCVTAQTEMFVVVLDASLTVLASTLTNQVRDNSDIAPPKSVEK